MEEYNIIIEKDKKTKQFYESVPNLPRCYFIGNCFEEVIINMKKVISVFILN